MTQRMEHLFRFTCVCYALCIRAGARLHILSIRCKKLHIESNLPKNLDKKGIYLFFAETSIRSVVSCDALSGGCVETHSLKGSCL